MVTRVRVGDLVQRRFVDVGRSYYARLMGVELEQQDPDLVVGGVREVLPDGRVRVRFDLMDRDTILKPEDVDVVAVPRWEGVLAKAALGIGDVVVTTWDYFGERMARYHDDDDGGAAGIFVGQLFYNTDEKATYEIFYVGDDVVRARPDLDADPSGPDSEIEVPLDDARRLLRENAAWTQKEF